MGRTYLPQNEDIELVLQKGAEFIEDKLLQAESIQRKRMKKTNQNAAKKRAQNLGLNPIDTLALEIRNYCNDLIIREVKRRKLTHVEIASISLTSRPRITSIMDRRIDDVTLDLMIRILAALGAKITFTF